MDIFVRSIGKPEWKTEQTLKRGVKFFNYLQGFNCIPALAARDMWLSKPITIVVFNLIKVGCKSNDILSDNRNYHISEWGKNKEEEKCYLVHSTRMYKIVQSQHKLQGPALHSIQSEVLPVSGYASKVKKKTVQHPRVSELTLQRVTETSRLQSLLRAWLSSGVPVLDCSTHCLPVHSLNRR